MKLSLVNLVPLKEVEFDSPAPEGMDIPNFDSLVDALRWKNDLENYSMDLENELKHAQRQFDDKLSGQGERGAEPEGGPIQQKIAGELDQIKSNIQILKKELNTVLAKIDYFDQNHLGEGTDAISTARALPNDRDEEDQENDDNLNMDDTKFEFNMREDKELDKNQQSIAAKWDKESKKLEGGLFDTSRELEKTDTKQFNINVSNKVSFLTKLRDDGKFKSTKITDDKIEGWAINPSVTGSTIASKMKPTTNEGSCGHGPNGVPGNTPGGTKGMPADDRTRGMLKMLIQKEIAKLNESDPFQDLYDKQNPNDPKPIKGKHYPDEETVKKLKKGPYSSGGQNAQKEGSFDKGLEDLMGKDDFEKATSNEVPGLGDTVIDDKTDISTGKKTFMKMMTQFTDEPFLIETGLKLYDAWARGEGGLKPSRILKILQDTSN